jgi:hypothetical protein
MMKTLLTICLLATATALAAPGPTGASPTVQGKVLEAKDSGGYTYLRLKTKDGETWAAVNRAAVDVGAQVSLENVMVMTDFQSKSLNRTFPTILFASLGGTSGAAASAPDMTRAHAGMGKPAPNAAPVKVAKASGANAYTVQELHAQAAKLKDKPVVLRAQVVKYNPGIMGKNWLHLRDGSGSEAAGNHDILATSGSEAKVGETVTVKGTLRVDKDFGAGYAYKTMIEDAAIDR